MAEHGEWNRKSATLSDVTAEKEYGAAQDFIVNDSEYGKLQWRDGAIWGDAYLTILRSELEAYIAAKPDSEHSANKKLQNEIRVLKKIVALLRRKRTALEEQKAVIERALKAKQE